VVQPGCTLAQNSSKEALEARCESNRRSRRGKLRWHKVALSLSLCGGHLDRGFFLVWTPRAPNIWIVHTGNVARLVRYGHYVDVWLSKRATRRNPNGPHGATAFCVARFARALGTLDAGLRTVYCTTLHAAHCLASSQPRQP
jgi:hypothetical protein